MSLLLHQGDALNAAIKNAIGVAEAQAGKIADPRQRATLLADIAGLYLRSGDSDRAQVTREKALALAAKFTPITWPLYQQLDFAVSLAKSGDRAAADKILNAFKKEADTDEVLRLTHHGFIARALHNLGDDKAARALTQEILKTALEPGPQQDELQVRFCVFNLAAFGDPDSAEVLLPKIKDPSERWTILREIARQRGRTSKAKGATAMKRCMTSWLSSKDKTPGTARTLVEVMAQVGMSAEAKELIARMPRLFPQKSDRIELLRAQTISYALLKDFPKALATAETISNKAQRRGTYMDITDMVVSANELATLGLIQKRYVALLTSSDGDRTGLLLLFEGARIPMLQRLKREGEAVAVLQWVGTKLAKLPDPRVGASLLRLLLHTILPLSLPDSTH